MICDDAKQQKADDACMRKSCITPCSTFTSSAGCYSVKPRPCPTLPYLNEVQRFSNLLSSHGNKVGLPSRHVILAIQHCSAVARPAADWVHDGPATSCTTAGVTLLHTTDVDAVNQTPSAL